MRSVNVFRHNHVGRLIACIFAAAMLLSCSQNHRHTFEHRLFGYDVEIAIDGVDRNLASRAFKAIAQDLTLIDSYTDPGKSKPLKRTNALLQGREWFSINPSLYELIQRSSEFYQKTDAVFNPAALGALRQAWGFDKETPNPDLKKVSYLLKQDLSMKDIEIEGIRVRGRKSQLRLDFDLLAIGYAIDSQLEHLSDLGISRAVLRIGPITGTLGSVPKTVTINNAVHVELQPGEAICNFSAADSRFPEHGRIDPRSAWPVKPIPSVVVIHGDASTASVACAALSTAGGDMWQQLTTGLGLTYARWRNGDLEHITPMMRNRLGTGQATKTGNH